MKQYKGFPDERLLKMCSMGYMECMNELIVRYEKKLKSYIRARVKRTDIADDIFQDVCLKIYLSVLSGRYHEDGKFFSWIIRIAHNMIMDQYRQSKKAMMCVASDYQYDVLSGARQELLDNSVEESIVNSQRLEEIGEIVKTLPEVQRQVIFMRHYAGMSFKEIAEETEVGINTALGRFRYGIINLRNILYQNKRVCI
jgi:RNA polymerase sigma-70 factor (ECF subfamily)